MTVHDNNLSILGDITHTKRHSAKKSNPILLIGEKKPLQYKEALRIAIGIIEDKSITLRKNNFNKRDELTLLFCLSCFYIQVNDIKRGCYFFKSFKLLFIRVFRMKNKLITKSIILEMLPKLKCLNPISATTISSHILNLIKKNEFSPLQEFIDLEA